MTQNRILVIHHGALGDVVSAFPALLRLKKTYGSIAILCQSNIGRLAQQFDIVDQWFPLEAAVFSSLYTRHVDPAVKTILLSFGRILLFSRSRFLEKTLFSIPGIEVYGIPPRPEPGQRIHVAEHILSNLIRCRLIEASDQDARSILSSSVYSDRRIERYDPLKIMIHPGSGSRKKCWPVSNFITVATSMGTRGWRPEFILGPAESDLDEILARSIRDTVKIHRPDHLTELAGLLKTAGGFIGNDSGVSHLAAFLGLPTVAVFGPSDPHIWKPVGRVVRAVGPDLECGPCFDTQTVGCKDMDCFNRITPEDVLTAFYELVD